MRQEILRKAEECAKDALASIREGIAEKRAELVLLEESEQLWLAVESSLNDGPKVVPAQRALIAGPASARGVGAIKPVRGKRGEKVLLAAVEVMGLGDKVRWTSQAGGFARTKHGEIVEVVPSHAYPAISIPGSGPGRCEVRDHESYVVCANGRNYWPRVQALVRG